MNLRETALPIWSDAYERTRLGDECWWDLVSGSAPVQTPNGVMMALTWSLVIYARSPVLGAGPIGGMLPIENPLALLDRETADYYMHAGLEQIRQSMSVALSAPTN
jgi:hypothetical protein